MSYFDDVSFYEIWHFRLQVSRIYCLLSYNGEICVDINTDSTKKLFVFFFFGNQKTICQSVILRLFGLLYNIAVRKPSDSTLVQHES